MCIIILDVVGNQLEEKYLRNLFTRNHDGFGIISLAEGTPHEPEKVANPKDVDEVLDLWKRYNDRPYIAHMRLKTHGMIDEENCHPYALGGDNYLFHNGVMSFIHQTDKKMSDTWHFAEYFMKPMGDTIFEKLEIPEFCATLGKIMGTNKLAFYHKSKKVYLINEKVGTWFVKDALWLSNELCLRNPLPPPTDYKQTTSFGFHNGHTGNNTPVTRPVNATLVTPNKETFTKKDLLDMSILDIAACVRFMPLTFETAVTTHFPEVAEKISPDLSLKNQAVQYFILFGEAEVNKTLPKSNEQNAGAKVMNEMR